MVEVLGLVLFLVLFTVGTLRFVAFMASRAKASCAEAARLLSLPSVPMSGVEAAETFLPEGRAVHGDVVAFRGALRDVEVVLAAFTHDSNTSVNGGVIPITATHVVARLRRPLSGRRVLISRRVFGSPDSDVALAPSLDRLAVVASEDPGALARLFSGQSALADDVAQFVAGGEGAWFVHDDRCAAFVAQHDPSKIRAAVRRAVDLARALDRAADTRDAAA